MGLYPTFGIKTKLDKASRFPRRQSGHIGLKALLRPMVKAIGLFFMVWGKASASWALGVVRENVGVLALLE